MSKTNITSKDVLKIVEKIWNENDIEIEREEYGKMVKTSCLKALRMDFYCFSKNVSTSHAVVKALKDDAMLSQDIDYGEKKALIQFLVKEKDINFLDTYVENIRTKYHGLLLDYEVAGISVKYIDFGSLQYDKKPEQSAIGMAIQCSVELKITFAGNVLVSGNKVWLLDGVELPYLHEGVDLEKLGNTNNIYGARATQTLPTGQSKFYRFTLPYVTDNEACLQIQREILAGDMTQVHTLSYYDGITHTAENPYTAKVTLFRTTRGSSNVASKSELDVVFTDADDQTKSLVKYEMALIDVFFDMGSINTRWFASRAEQEAWFSIRTNATKAPYATVKAPNIGSLTLTNQIYLAPSTADLNELLTKNYAVVKATEGDNVRYYYYYVQSATAGADNQIMVTLQMDSIQTYYFDPNIDISPCLINRAHLNRWIDNGDGTVSFDGRPESNLFKRENYQGLASRLVKRTPVYLCVDSNSGYDANGNFKLSPLDQWLKDNVDYWVYVYVNIDDDELVIGGYADKSQIIDGYDTGVVCYCYPIYKDRQGDKVISFQFNTDEGFMMDDLNNYIVRSRLIDFWNYVKLSDEGISNGPKSSNIIAVKSSCRPPFRYTQYNRVSSAPDKNDFDAYKGTNYSVSDNYLSIYVLYEPESVHSGVDIDDSTKGCGGAVSAGEYRIYSDSLGKEIGIIYGGYYQIISDTKYYPTELYKTSKKTHNMSTNPFDSQGIWSLGNKALNPKLINSDFFQLALESADGQRFDYDLQKLNREKFRLRYTEVLTPDITRGYLRIETDDESVYNSSTMNNLTGLVYSSDNSMIFTSSKWAEFTSNTKNFFLQAQLLKDYGKMQAQTNVASSLMGATQSGDPAAVPQSLINYHMSVEGTNLSHKMQMLSADNIKAAPNNLKNASGNACFIDSITSQKLYICEYEALGDELTEANDEMMLNGFTYGKLGRIKNFDNIRKHFNFVQAEVQSISGAPITTEARNDIRTRFLQGIRFWNQDNIDYNMDYDGVNFERSLEHGLPTFNVEVRSGENGSMNHLGTFQVHVGLLPLSATPNAGYEFENFYILRKNELMKVSSKNPQVIMIYSDTVITTAFKKKDI